MSEDLAKQLASYKAQLQQVEAALTGNGDNEDLLKLKKDLQVRIEKMHFGGLFFEVGIKCFCVFRTGRVFTFEVLTRTMLLC